MVKIKYRILLSFALVLINVLTFCEALQGRPNVVLIIADDMGWNDVSFHGSDQIPTPNIDVLAHAGVPLMRHYAHSVCTPSRAALLTGKFGYKTGMQGHPLTTGEERGLPLSEKILPQYLKELGYATHLVGKWHVGHFRQEYLPTLRGFDTHFGHRIGYIDYYEYTHEELWNIGKVSGMALFRNLSADWTTEGYITDVYTNEAKKIIQGHDISTPLFLTVSHNAPHAADPGALLQAPPKVVRSMRHVQHPQRRIYAAMMKKLDDGVGVIIEALEQKQILNNTLIIFISDNGGASRGFTHNWASNKPLRGVKATPWEGGIRTAALLWYHKLAHRGVPWEGYMHISDWLPTILGALDEEAPKGIDGINHWKQIINHENSTRDKVFEIDDYYGLSAIISGNYKLITGDVPHSGSDHYGDEYEGVIGRTPSYVNAIEESDTFKAFARQGVYIEPDSLSQRDGMRINCNNKVKNGCNPRKDKPCLFNIQEDPCEYDDLSALFPDVVKTLVERLQLEMTKTILRTVPLFRDPRANPKYFNNTWDVFIN